MKYLSYFFNEQRYLLCFLVYWLTALLSSCWEKSGVSAETEAFPSAWGLFISLSVWKGFPLPKIDCLGFLLLRSNKQAQLRLQKVIHNIYAISYFFME